MLSCIDRYKFVVIGFILGLSLMLFITESPQKKKTVENFERSSIRSHENEIIQLDAEMTVMTEAYNEKVLVDKILAQEGGERDLLALGDHMYEINGQLPHIGDTYSKIKRLERLIGELEQREKQMKADIILKKIVKTKGWKKTKKNNDAIRYFNTTTKKKGKAKTNCTSYNEDAHLSKTVIPFVLGGNSSVSSGDITFATHLSMQRLDVLEEIMKHWNGAISVALLATPTTGTQLTTALHKVRAFSQGRVDLHVVAHHGVYYPSNFLRNVALNHTRTDYVFLSDADFIPMYGLRAHIRTAIDTGLLDETNRVLIVPAFEFTKQGSAYPKTKEDLIKLWDDKKAFPFHYKLKPAHGPTNFTKWRQATSPYTIKWKQYFEPYIAMKTSQTPRYHEGFVGREFNKISHIMEVQARRFEFIVLSDTFTIHLPHKKTGTTSTNYKCAVHLYRVFQKSLRKKFHANV